MRARANVRPGAGEIDATPPATSTTAPSRDVRTVTVTPARKVIATVTRDATETTASAVLTDRPLPLVEASRLRYADWSPDGHWVVFWARSEEGLWLGLIAPATGELCTHQGLPAGALADGEVAWDGDALRVTVGDVALRGDPCGRLEADTAGARAATEGEISPDGRYVGRVESEQNGQYRHYTATIIRQADGAELATARWTASIHAIVRGPRWLDDDRFLLGPDLGSGILYLSGADGQVHNLMTELFGRVASPVVRVRPVHTGPTLTGAGRHILVGAGELGTPSLLYHPERRAVEELPFSSPRWWDADDVIAPYGFSPDGQWLLLGDPVDAPPRQREGADNWLRAVEAIGEPAVLMSDRLAVGALSPDGSRLALFDDRAITVVAFPDGGQIGRWTIDGFHLEPLGWSPDGSSLIAIGRSSGRPGAESLFLIQP